MKTHWFTLILSDADEPRDERQEDELCGALLAAGCDDALFGSRCGIPFLSFAREAESYDAAVASATAAVEGVGLTVVRVEREQESERPSTR